MQHRKKLLKIGTEKLSCLPSLHYLQNISASTCEHQCHTWDPLCLENNWKDQAEVDRPALDVPSGQAQKGQTAKTERPSKNNKSSSASIYNVERLIMNVSKLIFQDTFPTLIKENSPLSNNLRKWSSKPQPHTQSSAVSNFPVVFFYLWKVFTFSYFYFCYFISRTKNWHYFDVLIWLVSDFDFLIRLLRQTHIRSEVGGQ